MASVVPMQSIGAGGIDVGRPGQQLLPGYVVKLLKTLKIPFGTERGMTGIDVDPTINLIGHIFECIGTLREVNKVYRAKGSLASRSIGTRILFGLTSELGNILLDAITFDPPPELRDAAIYYSQISSNILTVFPEIASQVTPATGKVLLHQTALKTSAAMAIESLKMVIKAYPAAAWTPDKTGALPLHWITHNNCCNQEMIGLLIAANPKGPWVADLDGYLPLHWAVNQNFPNIDVVAALISSNGSAAAKPCNKGSLPIHWSVNRERPHIGVIRALAQIHPDGVRTFDKSGWLPLHQCANRSDISLEALNVLIELYPQGLQCPNSNGQLPLHRALDQTNPSFEAVRLMLNAFPGAAKVADDEGYLPIHLALDCARPNPDIAQLLLQQYPEAAFHKSKDGLLPIHCIISSMHPVIEIVQQLLDVFPDSSEIMAVDLMPLDETADPETWQGEWIEKRWTPLSRAIDRGLDSVVVLFRVALNSNQKGLERTASSASPQRILSSNQGNTASTSRLLPPQSKPPLNNLAALQAVSQHQLMNPNQIEQPINLHPDGGYTSGSYAGPSTSSAEAHNRSRLVLGGNLDNEDEVVRIDNMRTPFQQTDPDAEGSRVLQSRPGGGVPPPLRDRAPGGSVVGRTASSNRNVSREKDRSESRDKDRDRDRDRDRERRRRRENSESRERSRHRSSEDKRSSSRRGDRDRDRDRDRHRESEGEGDDYYDDDRRHHSSRNKSHHHNRSSSRQTREPSDPPPYRAPQQGRIYEQTENDDEQVYPISEGMENLNLSMKSQRYVQESPYTNADPRDLTNPYASTPQLQDSSYQAAGNSAVNNTSLKALNRPQSASNPPNSLLDAANARPFSRKGHSAGKQRRPEDGSGSYRQDLQHSRDANPEDYSPVAVNINIRDVNHHHSSSIDDMV